MVASTPAFTRSPSRWAGKSTTSTLESDSSVSGFVVDRDVALARCLPLAPLRRHTRQDGDVIHGPDLDGDTRKRRGLAGRSLPSRLWHPARNSSADQERASTSDRSTTSASPAPASAEPRAVRPSLEPRRSRLGRAQFHGTKRQVGRSNRPAIPYREYPRYETTSRRPRVNRRSASEGAKRKRGETSDR